MLSTKKLNRPRVTYEETGYRRARREAEAGDPRRLLAMMDECVRDPFVSGCLIGRRAGVRRSFVVDPYEAENAADIERAQWMSSVVRQLRTRRLFRHVQAARLYWFSVTDFVWGSVDGYTVPVEIKAFSPYDFRYDKDGTLGVDWGREIRPIPDDVLVCHADESPTLLNILPSWILMEFGWESYSAYTEIIGDPMLWSPVPDGASSQQREQIQKSVEEMGLRKRATGPPGSKPEIVQGSDSDLHDRFVSKLESKISVGILGHENAVRDRQGLQVGENSSPFQAREDVVIDDLDYIDECVEALVKLIYDQNFEDQRYPRLVTTKPLQIHTQTQIDRLRCLYDIEATILPSELAKLGVEIAPDQEPITRVRLNPFD